MSRRRPPTKAERLELVRKRVPVVAQRGREFYREQELRRRAAERRIERERAEGRAAIAVSAEPSTVELKLERVTSDRGDELDRLLGIVPRPFDSRLDDPGVCPRCGRVAGRRPSDGAIRRHRIAVNKRGGPPQPVCEPKPDATDDAQEPMT